MLTLTCFNGIMGYRLSPLILWVIISYMTTKIWWLYYVIVVSLSLWLSLDRLCRHNGFCETIFTLIVITIFGDYIVRFGEKKWTSCLNNVFRKSKNKFIGKLYEEETLFISTFNTWNFMKIRVLYEIHMEIC